MNHLEFIAGVKRATDLGAWVSSLSQHDISTHIPEIAALGGVCTTNGNVLDHTVRVCSIVSGKTRDTNTRIAALYHDVGKIITSQIPEYLRKGMDIQHQQWSEIITRERLSRWRFDQYSTAKILNLIRTHMLDINPHAGDASVRKFIATIRPENLSDWFALRMADSLAYGQADCQQRIRQFYERTKSLLGNNKTISVSDLAISLADLVEEYGSCDVRTLETVLNRILEGVQTFTYANTRHVLMGLASDMLILGV